MPFTINTRFKWELLGKIQGSDVVDFTNITLQLDMLKDMTGLTSFYAVVFTSIKKKDLSSL